MAKGPETRLQKKIQEGLNKAFPGSFFFKTHGGPYQQAGIPDLIGSVNGIFVGIEVKVPGKENNTTKLQEHCIKQIRDSGGIAFVSSNVDNAITSINIELTKRDLKARGLIIKYRG